MIRPSATGLFSISFTTAAVTSRFSRRLSEWHLAVVMLVAGVMVNIGDVLDLPRYELVRDIADPGTWAVAMMVVGGSRLAALLINGSRPRFSAHLRYLFASMSAFIWALMLAGLLAFGETALIGPFLGMAIVVDLVSAFRAATEAREADDSDGGGNARAR